MVAIVAFALWSRITTRRMALVLALVTTLIGLANSAIEPYSWLASATIPPLAVLAWRWLTRLRQTGAIGDLGAVVIIGVALGLFGVTYTLLFGYFAVVLGLFAWVAVGLVWRRKLDREQAEPPPVPPGRVGRGALVAAAVAAAISLAVLLPVWGPYMFGVDGEHGENVAAHYLPRLGAYLPIPMNDFTVTGLLCLSGVISPSRTGGSRPRRRTTPTRRATSPRATASSSAGASSAVVTGSPPSSRAVRTGRRTCSC